MSEQIIISLITAGLPVLATAISSLANRRRTDRNAAKQSILQMIMEDHIAVQEGHLPTNYKSGTLPRDRADGYLRRRHRNERSIEAAALDK